MSHPTRLKGGGGHQGVLESPRRPPSTHSASSAAFRGSEEEEEPLVACFTAAKRGESPLCSSLPLNGPEEAAEFENLLFDFASAFFPATPLLMNLWV